MKQNSIHRFYIPVMGTGFTLDTPLHVARYGISSVVSLVDDTLMEKMRQYYCRLYAKPYFPITQEEEDARARRVTAYLDLTEEIVSEQIADMKRQSITLGTEAYRYFELLPETSPLKKRFTLFLGMKPSLQRDQEESILLSEIRPGAINSNIMTKVDKDNFKGLDPLPAIYSDASAALRGFALSRVKAALVFSAGLNKRLFGYLEQFNCFFPDRNGMTEKTIIIKVSDFRSALIQGKILARRGIWVSEFRIESGLNCGGHAFPTKGHLLGPVLQEFKNERAHLIEELGELYTKGLRERSNTIPQTIPDLNITVQGGVSTAEEHDFLMKYYNIDAAGWGTPFLLVPEATSVDMQMLAQLASASEDDVHLSNASPLNVGFQNLRQSASEMTRRKRIENGQPGSPCPKGFLAFNTEFGGRPVCTASKAYQVRKIQALKEQNLSRETLSSEIGKVTDKACICHELGDSALGKHGIETADRINSAVCPGPNIAYFSREYSLSEMIQHIYGRINLFEKKVHASLFATELRLYIQNLRNSVQKTIEDLSETEIPQLKIFQENLNNGIEYYRSLMAEMTQFSEQYRERFDKELKMYKNKLDELMQQVQSHFPSQFALAT